MNTSKIAAIAVALGLSASAGATNALADSGADVVVVETDAFPESDRGPIIDGFPALVDHEARAALAEGRIERAYQLLQRLVELRPNDLWAWRELGRVAAALGDSARAVRILRQVDDLQEHAPDPELHFIVGQALIALDRREAGLAELARAERELAIAEPSARRTMWLARIHALRGDYLEAERAYLAMLPTDVRAPEYEGVSLSLAEAYLLAKQWDAAESRLRTFLDTQPDHERAREMLAWTLESRGKLHEELNVRTGLADQLSITPGRHAASQARAFERAYAYPSALEAYRFAAASGVSVDDEIDRIEGYLAPEIGGAAAVFTDPLGDRFRSTGGMSIPLSGRLRAVVVGGYETATALDIVGYEADARRLVSMGAMGLLEMGRGTQLAAGAVGWQSGDGARQLGGQAMLRTSPARPWSVYLRAEANTPWRESAATVREGGTTDQLELQLYATPFTDRLVLMVGGRARRLGLEMAEFLPRVHARQIFATAGFDVVASRGNGYSARGQMLDGDFLSPSPLSSGVVLSYRHYETRSDSPFEMRLPLVEQSSLDELSATARHVLDQNGVLSIAATSGVGYDRLRTLWRWRAAGLLYISPSDRSRLSLSVETASETTSGITGRNAAAMMGIHVDL